MRTLLTHLSTRERLMGLVAVAFIVLQVWLDLLLPDYMATITTLLQSQDSTRADLLAQGGGMIACAVGSGLASVVVGYIVARISAGLARTLRAEVFNHSLSFSQTEIARFSAASLLNRATNDITQVQNVLAMGLQALIKAPILAVWAILKISGKSWQWTTATGVAVLVLCMMLAVVVTVAVPRFRLIQGLTDVLNRVTREHLTGIRVVHAYNAEAYQEDAFDRANQDITRTNLVASRVMALMTPGMTLISSGLTLAVYALGAGLIEAASGPRRLSLFADMVVFSNYAMQVIMAFMLLTMVFVLLPRAQVSASRIQEVLDTTPAVADAPGPSAGTADDGAAAIVGQVAFEDVAVRYEGSSREALSGISFTAEPGQTVAIIGATGSGKSTLVDLVPRFQDATSGRVLVDGRDVRDYRLDELRTAIGYVPQRAYLFTGTVASNTAYPALEPGPREMERVERAVATAQSADFVAAMEGGYEAAINQGGTNLSGGQRQRLAIARALARDPRILIFDDSFSALDYATDRSLRDALAQRSPRATTLVVAQRIGTIRDADLIVVLDHGRMVGKGTHEELLASCPTYQEIASSQLSPEELAHA